LHPHRLVYRDAHQQVAGTIKLNGDGNLNVVIVPADLTIGAQHRLSVWVHATFAAACGLKADTLIVSRKGTSIETDRMPPITPSLAKSKLHELLELFKEAQLHPLPFSPKTSAAIFAATEVGGDAATAANKAWEEAFLGPPGDGQSASARLSWRGQDPFAEHTLGEWCRLAELVFRPVNDWFAETVDIVGDESTDG
jgi:exonuclease V gamma subunit